MILEKLAHLQGKVIGSIPYDQELIKRGLPGQVIVEYLALDDAAQIVQRLE